MAIILSMLAILPIGILGEGRYPDDVRDRLRRKQMLKVGLFVRLEAKAGKEDDVVKFLEAGLALALQETTTPLWFALRLGPSTFGVFDAFAEESGRQAHLNGPIAQALMAKAPELFAQPPAIAHVDVLGAKLP